MIAVVPESGVERHLIRAFLFRSLHFYLRRSQLKHFLGNSVSNFFCKQIANRSADKTLAGEHYNLARRYWNGKRTDKFHLVIIELIGGEFGYKGDAFTAFHDAHKGFDAAERIGFLALVGRFEMTEFYELIAETVSFVEQPQIFFGEIACFDGFVFK